MERKPEDLCLICLELEKKASKKGSHFVPAGIIAPCVNKRDYEESFEVDILTGSVDTYFGRSNVKNNEFGIITKKKKNHYTLDYIFCPECEHRLGVLEGKITNELVELLRNPNQQERFWHGENSFGVHLKVPLKLLKEDFIVFFFSIAFRFNILYQITHDKNLLSDEECGKLRNVICEYIYNNSINKSQEDAKYFYFYLLTKYEFKNGDPTFIMSSSAWDEPNIFYVCQFVILWYSINDTESDITNPYWDIKNSLDDENPCIIFMPDEVWESIMNAVGLFTGDFLTAIGERLHKINGKSIQENINEFISVFTRIKNTDKSELDINYTELALRELQEKYSR